MAFTYARITLADSVELSKGAPRRFILQITRETAVLLSGVEVDKYGDEVPRKNAKGEVVDVTRHVISKDLIAKRVPLVMNKHYAMLEPAE